MVCSCGNSAWVRIPTKGLGPDFTDCRNYLQHIPTKCSKCGTKRKVNREFVKDGMMTWQDWHAQEGFHQHDDWMWESKS
jgi:hypothetical protein